MKMEPMHGFEVKKPGVIEEVVALLPPKEDDLGPLIEAGRVLTSWQRPLELGSLEPGAGHWIECM